MPSKLKTEHEMMEHTLKVSCVLKGLNFNENLRILRRRMSWTSLRSGPE